MVLGERRTKIRVINLPLIFSEKDTRLLEGATRGQSVKIYTRTIVVVLLFALFVAFSSTSLCAQQRGGGRGGQPRTGAAGPGAAPRTILPPEVDNRPFDITLQQLPPQYLAYDAELAYTRIRNGKENSKKGELEASTYAFRFNPEERFYNVPDRILHVYCPLSKVLQNGKEDETRRGLRVKYQPRVDNKHIGTNACGAKVEFEELKFREYLVAFNNFREFPVRQNGSETITGEIRALPADAAQLEERIAVLLVCALMDPYVASDSVQQKPTPERPRDYFAQYYYLNVHLLELWFYNFDTGKVLLKMKAGEASQ
jgi:hypothetical protein